MSRYYNNQEPGYFPIGDKYYIIDNSVEYISSKYYKRIENNPPNENSPVENKEKMEDSHIEQNQVREFVKPVNKKRKKISPAYKSKRNRYVSPSLAQQWGGGKKNRSFMKMVSPVQMAIDQAKARLAGKRQRKRRGARSSIKVHKVQRKRKGGRKTKRRRNANKRRKRV